MHCPLQAGAFIGIFGLPATAQRAADHFSIDGAI